MAVTMDNSFPCWIWQKRIWAVQAKENVADGGYFSSSQIGLAESAQYEVLTNAPSTDTVIEGSEAPPYHTSRFIYDEQHDCVICPHGAQLTFSGHRIRGSNNNEFKVYRCRNYKACPHRAACSRKKDGRAIEISIHHKALERQRKKRQDIEARCFLKMRKIVVEPVFAWIKRNMGFNRWTVLGLANVKSQWDLVCPALNLKRLYRHWKTKELILETTG